MRKILSCMMIGVLAISISACNSQNKMKNSKKVSVFEVSNIMVLRLTSV